MGWPLGCRVGCLEGCPVGRLLGCKLGCPVGTLVAALAGVVEVTVGGGGGCTVVNVQV